MTKVTDYSGRGAARRRNALRATSAAAALALGLLPGLAYADNECGDVIVDSDTQLRALCTGDGNPYRYGITYTTDRPDAATSPPVDLTIALADGVHIDSRTYGVSATAVFSDRIRVIAQDDVSIAMTGKNVVGVNAVSDAGDIDIDLSRVTAPITVSGRFGTGINAVSNAGDVSVKLNDLTVTGVGATGIKARSEYDSVKITANDIAVAGTISKAITASGADGVDINVHNIDVNGYHAYGIVASTVRGSGAINIYANSVQASGQAAFGIAAGVVSGNTTINVGDVTISGDGGFGILVQAIPTGFLGNSNYSGFSQKIMARNVSTSGNNSEGIFIQGLSGTSPAQVSADPTTRLEMDLGDVYTKGNFSDGIFSITSKATVNVAISGRVETFGSESDAVQILNLGGDTTVELGRNTVTHGDQSFGAVVQGNNAKLVNDGNIITFGQQSDGVSASGVPLIASKNEGRDIGGRLDIINGGKIVTRGPQSKGINVAAGTTTIVGNGSIESTDIGIYAASVVGALTVQQASISTTGDEATGLSVRTRAFPADLNVGFSGIFLPISIDVGTINTAGTDADGIKVIGDFDDPTTIRSDAITTNGNGSTGIQVVTRGDVAIDVGSVRTAGTDAPAIAALTNGGSIDVAVRGTIDAAHSDGIALFTDVATVGIDGSAATPVSTGTVDLTIAKGGSVAAAGDAVGIASIGGVTVTNGGTITGGTGYALNVSGGAASVRNTGEIAGRLKLSEAADGVTNDGRLTLTGDSDFGAGDDTLTNTGTIRLALGARSASVAGLERLTNSGTIDLRNGLAGDTLTFGGTAYRGSGAAALGLDIQFADGGAVADRVAFGSASGRTEVVLNPIGTAGVLTAPVTLITLDTAPAAGTFVLAEASSNMGLVGYQLRYDAGAGGYELVSGPSGTVYRRVVTGETLTNLWHRSADAIAAHLSAERNAAWGGEAPAAGGRIWGEFSGELHRRSGTRSFSALGLDQRVDLGYRQDAIGYQTGIDFIGTGEGSAITAGVTGGYASSHVHFRGDDERIGVDALNAGVYAGFRSGPLFVNGLAKYDHYWLNRRSLIAGLDRNSDTGGWGGRVEAGARLGSATFFAEPAASIAYSRIGLDDERAAAGARFDYDRFEGLRGKAGLTLGGRKALGASGAVMTFYGGGAAVHEFEGKDGLTFSSGGQSIRFRGDAPGTWGQGTLGFAINTPGGVTGFIEGHGEYGDDYKGGGGRAGIRVRF